ncbi:MAG: enoyl-CoA hydratase-related protein, partial [Ignavibacteria bacterium]|nr:enoyl-CoA hydratase-related protein [Ignavibacteria bacterium]
MEKGKVVGSLINGVASISFSHPKSNSLTANLADQITALIDKYSSEEKAHVIVIRSEGEKIFCAGAS